jgi:hypothetical protein
VFLFPIQPLSFSRLLLYAVIWEEVWYLSVLVEHFETHIITIERVAKRKTERWTGVCWDETSMHRTILPVSRDNTKSPDKAEREVPWCWCCKPVEGLVLNFKGFEWEVW